MLFPNFPKIIVLQCIQQSDYLLLQHFSLFGFWFGFFWGGGTVGVFCWVFLGGLVLFFFMGVWFGFFGFF